MKVRFAVAPDRGWLSASTLLDFADAIEAAGFDGVWLSDLPLAPALDPLLGIAVLAGRTSRLRLGANVVPLGRNPFVLAKQLAQLDQVSDGRLLLSFVTGINQLGERAALGIAGATRGELLEHTLVIARGLWAGEAVDNNSGRLSLSGVRLPIRPVQAPLEVWLGGRGPKALERAGRIADGWLGAQLTPAEAGRAREQIQLAAAHVVREVDPEHFGLSIAYAREEADPELLHTTRARRPDIDPRQLIPVGAKALRSLLEQYIDAGLSKFVIRPGERVDSWTAEAEWLAGAILDLQT
ncbi:MAG: LLM class flavin-dependent oxidoreductase [Solirubrobacterales bacterium]|nr:LLM class flavin-dependent oxidoreductase [Solirubrobacterales bacterium]MBV9714034.1 LLM class flavin-dependent oxidoreductase [Solirubrobacterales bacterium]